MAKSALIVNIPPTSSVNSTASPYHVGSVCAPPSIHSCTPAHNTYAPTAVPYTVTDMAVTSIQGVSGNNVYAVPGNLDLVDSDPDIIEFPRDNLRFVEKLGEGQFGEVSASTEGSYVWAAVL